MSMAYIGAALAVGSAVYGISESANQKRRAKHQLEDEARNKPVDVIPKELIQNQELGALRSKTGLPSEQYAMAMKNIQRQQAKTLKSASDRRMGLGLLGTVDDNAQRAIGNLDAQNANARVQNEKTLIGVNNQVANWKTGQFNRQIADWNNRYDYSMGLLGSGNQNMANSIQSGIGAIGSIAGSAWGGNNSNASWANGLFGKRKIPQTSRTYQGGAKSDYQAGW